MPRTSIIFLEYAAVISVGCFFTVTFFNGVLSSSALVEIYARSEAPRALTTSFVSARSSARSVELVQPERGADEPEQNPDERQYAGPPV